MPTTSRATRRQSKAIAHATKAGGGGSPRTGTTQTANINIVKGLIGAGVGFVTGGPAGAIAGGIAGATGGDAPVKGSGGQAFGPSGDGCPRGTIRVRGTCIDPTAVLPGGDPATFPASGTPVATTMGNGARGAFQTTQGAFGMPAAVPVAVSRIRLRCPRGMVLGTDDLCYPKGVLRRNSRNRKWRQPARPKLTAGDMNAIRKAAALQKDIKDAAQTVGFKVTRK